MTNTLLRSCLLAGSAAALLCGTAVGQSYYYAPSNTPTVGTCNVFPWGQSSTRHQHVVTAAELGNAAQNIRDIAYAACGSGTFTATQILIRMDHYPGTTLSSTFASNLSGNEVTVLNATNWSYSYTANAWADIGLANTFNYDPALGNLLIDIEFCGGAGGGSFHRDVAPRCYANGGPCPSAASGTSTTGALKVRIDAGTGGSYSSFGQGCGNPALTLAGIGVPNIGTMSSVAMSNGDPNNIGFYGVAFTPTNISLPGAPGCTQYIDPLIVAATVFDGLGDAPSFDLQIPNYAGLVGVMVVQTGISLNPLANALGVTTANGVTITIGM